MPPHCHTIVGCVLGMKVNMPLVTLLSGAALGVGVLVASMLSTSNTASASGAGVTSPTTGVRSRI